MGLYMLLDMAIGARLLEWQAKEDQLTQKVDTQIQRLNVFPVCDLRVVVCDQEVHVVRQPTDRKDEYNDDHHFYDLCECQAREMDVRSDRKRTAVQEREIDTWRTEHGCPLPWRKAFIDNSMQSQPKVTGPSCPLTQIRSSFLSHLSLGFHAFDLFGSRFSDRLVTPELTSDTEIRHSHR